MKEKLISLVLALVMSVCAVGFVSCGTTQTEDVDDTLKAADPMTEEEIANDKSKGCVENSDDLLY